MTPSFKGFGLEMVWFAQQEREAYRRLFLNKKFASFRELMDEVGHFDEIIYSVQESFHLTRGMLCAMKRRELPAVEQVCAGARRVAVLERVMNPTNVGAIFRSAAALGGYRRNPQEIMKC